jgi:hypothetical protein
MSPALPREIMKGLRVSEEGMVSPDFYTVREKDYYDGGKVLAQMLGFGDLETYQTQSENVAAKEISTGLEKQSNALDRRWYITQVEYERNSTDANLQKIYEAEEKIE